jgi:hypothetical protein
MPLRAQPVGVCDLIDQAGVGCRCGGHQPGTLQLYGQAGEAVRQDVVQLAGQP